MSPRSRHDHFPHEHTDRHARRQHAASALAAHWQRDDARADSLLGAMHALDRAAADPDTIFATLRPWLADTNWLGRRLDEALALSAADCFALAPLRVFHGPALGGLIVAEAGAITLTLMLRPFDAMASDSLGPPPSSAIFLPGHGLTRVLAPGGAQLLRHHVAVTAAEAAGCFTAAAASACITDPPRALDADEWIGIDQTRESFTLIGGTGDILLLQLFVQRPGPLPIREYDVASGRLVKLASSRRDTSFRQMALALLRTMHRTDAVPFFAVALTQDDFAMRWQAMRELIALAPAAAHPHLTQMAVQDPHPEVRHAAATALNLLLPPLAGGKGEEKLRCLNT